MVSMFLPICTAIRRIPSIGKLEVLLAHIFCNGVIRGRDAIIIPQTRVDAFSDLTITGTQGHHNPHNGPLKLMLGVGFENLSTYQGTFIQCIPFLIRQVGSGIRTTTPGYRRWFFLGRLFTFTFLEEEEYRR